MEHLESILKSAEEIRYNYTRLWGILIFESGSIVLKRPELNDCLTGLLYQMSIEIKDNSIEKLEFQLEYPFIIIKDELNESLKKTVDSIVEFIEFCTDNKEKVQKLVKELSDGIAIFSMNLKKWSDEYSLKSNNISDLIQKYKNHEEKNKGTVQYAFTKISEISNRIQSHINDLSKFRLNYREFDKKKLKFKDKVLDNRKLFYEVHENSEKLDNFNEWQMVMNRFRNNTKYIEKSSTNIPDWKFAQNQNKNGIERDEKKLFPTHEEVLKNQLEALELNNIKLQETIKRDRKKVSSIPVFYVNKQLPLHSWTLTMNTSFNLSADDYPTCIENFHLNQCVILGTKKGFIHIYSLTNNEIINSVKAHDRKVKVICYLNDSKTLISGSKDGILKQWNINDMDFDQIDIKNSAKSINSITKSLLNHQYYVASDTFVFVIDFYSKFSNDKINFKERISDIKFLEEFKILSIAFQNGKIKLFDIENRETVFFLENVNPKLLKTEIIEFENKPAILTTSNDSKIRIFNADKEFKLIKVIDSPNAKYCANRVIYCSDMKTIITTHKDGKFFTVNFQQTEKKKYFFSMESKITCISYYGDGKSIILGNKEGNIDIFTAI